MWAASNLQARTNALGNSLQYRYDGFGRLTHLINENGADYRFAWDAQDPSAVAERGFDGRRLDYRYNRIGHLLEMVDGLPQGAVLDVRQIGRHLPATTRNAGQVPGTLPTEFTLNPRLATDTRLATNGTQRPAQVAPSDGGHLGEIFTVMVACTLAHRYDR